MADTPKHRQRGIVRSFASGDVLLTAALFGIIFLLVLPIPTLLMDLLLSISFAVGLLILLVVLYVRDPSEFSVFPTVLLAITLFRLGLNVASTRLILLDGYAGQVIQSFGEFVVRGNYVVGAVVFLILVIINFMVITKGAGRIAEVAARFTLDALPGKQMAIDAELNAGIIDEKTATDRRYKIQKEADFYGSMDGASKFVRGDAVAGILITIVNVIGGIAIGVMQRNMGLNEALEKYTLLSIGDGLVSQIPSLIVSVGAGILVTRSTESTNLGSFIGKQLTFYPRAIASVAIMLVVFALLPGMPFVPFSILAVGVGIGAFFLYRQQAKVAAEEPAAVAGKPGATGAGQPGEGGEAAGKPSLPAPQTLEEMIQVDAFAVELGYGLLQLADTKKNGDLVERITGVRKNFAGEMGMIVPPIAVRDNLELETNDYRFLMRGKEIARGAVMPQRFLAMNVSESDVKLKGVHTTEPVFSLPATWIGEDERKNAELNGYTVVDAPSVLITHLAETLKEHAADILEREDVQRLVDLVKEKNPTLIGELLPDLVNVGLIQRVLRNLLGEKIPIKNLTLILETIADYANVTKNPDDLAEQARRRLGPYFVPDLVEEGQPLRALVIEPKLEQHLSQSIRKNQFEVGLVVDPETTQAILQTLQPRVDELLAAGHLPVLITGGDLRLPFKRFFGPSFPRLIILSYPEIPNNLRVENAGVISAPVPERAEPASAEAQAVPA